MKILALQLKRIGDLILTTPALLALRQNLPNAHLTLAIEAGCRELLPAIDFVDDTFIYHRSGGNGALWWKLVSHGFDVCLDFTGNDRSAFFAVLSKSSKRFAYDWIQRSPWRPIFYNGFIRSSVRENHTVDHYLHMLRALKIEAQNVPVTLHLPEWSHKKARQLLLECGVEGAFVLVHPGTARPEKYWLPERWAEVMDFCERELRVPCVLSGSADGVEQGHVAKIKAALRVGPARDLSGRLDLLTLAALTQLAQLVLTVDSAPMHLAGAFGTPQVALFGKTNPFHWRPRHANAFVILAGNPAANPPFKPHHEAAEMSEISTQTVFDVISAASANVQKT
ncbi:MAG: heptosyltransferase [Chthoniobacter sp.]|jgi:ADP-heptose:LPS heptosyltransferase|nr:heptosyltransferase [Chthoniobacter sp.]